MVTTVEPKIKDALNAGASPDDVMALMKTQEQRDAASNIIASVSDMDSTAFTMDDMQETTKTSLHPENINNTAFYAAALSNETASFEDKVKTYYDIKQELEANGYSAVVDDLKNTLSKQEGDIRSRAVLQTIYNPNIDQYTKEQVVKTYLAEKDVEAQLDGVYVRNVAATSHATTRDELNQEEVDFDFLNKRVDAQRDIRSAITQRTMQLDDSFLSGVAGFVSSIVPFWSNAALQNAKQDALDANDPWYMDVWNTMFSGSNRKELIAAFNKAGPVEKADIANKFLQALDASYITDYQRYELITRSIENPDIANWEVVLDNIVGIVDALAVGKLAKSTVNTVTKVVKPSSPMAKTIAANPEEAGNLTAAALKDETGELARAAGTTREELMGEVLPKHTDEALMDAPAGVAEKMDEVDAITNDVLVQSETHGINYTELEKALARDNVDSLVNNITGMTIKTPQSVIVDDGERYAVKAMYGTEKGGFKSLAEAQARFEESFSGLKENIKAKYFKRNPATGEYVEATAEDLSKGRGKFGQQWFVQASFDHVYNPYDKAIFGADAVAFGGGGLKGGYLLDVSSRFNRQIAQAMIRADQVGTATEMRLLKLVDKHLRQLSGKSQKKVLEAIEQGSKEEKVFTWQELALRDFSVEEMNGYYTYRKVQDVNWTIANRAYKKQLEMEGMSRILVKGEDDARYGTVYETADEAMSDYDSKIVYNPSLGGITELDKEGIRILYNAGGKIARLRKMHKDGNQFVEFMALPSESVTVTRIPDNPLPYIKGYVQRSYKDYFFVDKIPKTIIHNGKKLSEEERKLSGWKFAETVASSSLRGKAEKWKQLATEQDLESEFEYVVRPGREYGDSIEKDFSMYKRGLRQTKGRGEHILNAEDEAASIEDPISSLLRTTRSIARQAGYSDFIMGMKRSFVKSYSKILKEPGKFPADVRDIYKRPGINQKEYDNAVALWQQINYLTGSGETMDSMFQKFMFNTATMLEGYSVDGLRVLGAKPFRKLSETHPLAATKKLTSTLFIAWRPLRQIVVQPSQLARMAALDPQYILTGKAPRELLSLSVLSIARDSKYLKHIGVSKDDVYAFAAKMWGTSVDEMKQIDREFFELSGIPGSIDRNILVEAGAKVENYSAFNTTAQRAKRYAKNALVEFPRKLGWESGEFLNVAGSWAFARRKYLRENPGAILSEKKHADKVAALGQELASNMIRPGAMQYQSGVGLKGVMSLPLQYMAVPHKALLEMIPTKLGGNKMWSQAEKNRILATNFTLAGSYGVGLYWALDSAREKLGVNVPDDLWLAVKGGLYDWGLNKLLDTMLDEKGGSVKFAESLTATPERIFPMADVMTSFMNNDLLTAMMGPSAHIIGPESRFQKAFTDVKTIFGVADVSTPEKLKLSMMATANVASGYNDWLKFRVADKMGRIVSTKGGDTGLEASRKEAIAKLFGFPTYEEADLYKLQNDRYGSPADKGDKDGYYSELNAAADSYYQSVTRIVQLYQNDPEKLNAQLMGHRAMLTFLDEEERDLILTHIQQLDRQTYYTTRDSITNRLFRDVLAGPDMATMIGNKIQNNEAIAPEEKRKLFDLINLVIGEEIY